MSSSNGDSLTKKEVLDKVIEIAKDQLMVDPNEEVKQNGSVEDLNFVEDLGADSLDSVELIMEIEDEFDLTIDDADAEKYTTIGLVTDHIFSRLTQTEG